MAQPIFMGLRIVSVKVLNRYKCEIISQEEEKFMMEERYEEVHEKIKAKLSLFA